MNMEHGHHQEKAPDGSLGSCRSECRRDNDERHSRGHHRQDSEEKAGN